MNLLFEAANAAVVPPRKNNERPSLQKTPTLHTLASENATCKRKVERHVSRIILSQCFVRKWNKHNPSKPQHSAPSLVCAGLVPIRDVVDALEARLRKIIVGRGAVWAVGSHETCHPGTNWRSLITRGCFTAVGLSCDKQSKSCWEKFGHPHKEKQT